MSEALQRLEYQILTGAGETMDRRYYAIDGGEITEAAAIRQVATTGCMLTSYSFRPTPAQDPADAD
jgi:hypothetical protein